MNDIKKIVLFKDETSKDGGSWLIIRDSGYESVSLNEGKRICAEYAAMNGITTREMVNEQLLNKVVFYSPDFNSALRDYVFNNNNNDYKNVHAENNDIVSGENDNISNDVYNFDISAGTLITNEELCQKVGENYSNIQEQIVQGIRDYYGKFGSGTNKEWLESRMNESLGEENLAETKMFLEKGKIKVFYKVKALAGASYYYNELDI